MFRISWASHVQRQSPRIVCSGGSGPVGDETIFLDDLQVERRWPFQLPTGVETCDNRSPERTGLTTAESFLHSPRCHFGWISWSAISIPSPNCHRVSTSEGCQILPTHTYRSKFISPGQLMLAAFRLTSVSGSLVSLQSLPTQFLSFFQSCTLGSSTKFYFVPFKDVSPRVMSSRGEKGCLQISHSTEVRPSETFLHTSQVAVCQELNRKGETLTNRFENNTSTEA